MHKIYAPSLFVLLFLSMGFCSFSQHKVTATVLDENDQPVINATVSLWKASDSSLVKTDLADRLGKVIFENLPGGAYLCNFSAIGFAPQNSPSFILNADSDHVLLPAVKLSREVKELSAVKLAAKKPFIERQPDKIVLNVESSITAAGSNVLEVLQKAPGVNVDQNDNIGLKGKQGTLVMIDGKLTALGGADLANLLKGMPASTVDKIEIISNPSAKYDAAGTAGIINIRTKKDQRVGLNGTFTAGYGQGIYPKANTGLSFNYRNKKINVFGNYSYSYRKSIIDLTLIRKFYEGDVSQGGYVQNSFFIFPYSTQVAKTGLDYFVSKKLTLGAVVSGVTNRFQPRNDENSTVIDPLGATSGFYTTKNRSSDRWNNYAGNLNLRYAIDTSGAEFTTDLDYARYWNTTRQHFFTDYFDQGHNLLAPSDTLLGFIKGNLTIYSIKSDYVKPFKNNRQLEAGVKSSWVKADNDLQFYNQVGGVQQFDAGRSNHFIYDENINAAYINYKTSWKKYDLQLGLRAEQTHAKGNQLITGQQFDTSYIQLFPSFFVSRKLSPKNELSFSVSKRIDRPSYKQLNPFRFYIDPTTFTEGNPYLRPQVTYNYELGYTYDQKFNATLGFSTTLDNITTVLLPDSTLDKSTLQTDKNITSFNYFGLNLSMPVAIRSWWNTFTNVNIYYGHYRGNLVNTNLNNGNTVFDLSSNHTFTVKKLFNAELNIKYTSKQVYGYFYVRGSSNVSLGIQRNILKGKGSLKLNLTDIFWNDYPQGLSTFSSFSEYFSNRRDSRVLNLAFTYRFGKKTIAPVKVRTGGAQEEKQRAGNGG